MSIKTSIQINGCNETNTDLSGSSPLFVVEVPSSIENAITFGQTTTFNSHVVFNSTVDLTTLFFGLSLLTGSFNFLTSSLNNKVYLISASSNATLTLPSASNGTHFYIKRIDGNDYTISLEGSGSVLIDRSSTINFNTENASMHLTSYNSNWWII